MSLTDVCLLPIFKRCCEKARRERPAKMNGHDDSHTSWPRFGGVFLCWNQSPCRDRINRSALGDVVRQLGTDALRILLISQEPSDGE
jgi:hypothetical protein